MYREVKYLGSLDLDLVVRPPPLLSWLHDVEIESVTKPQFSLLKK